MENEFGIDLTLLDERLALPPCERWERYALALVFVEETQGGDAHALTEGEHR